MHIAFIALSLSFCLVAGLKPNAPSNLLGRSKIELASTPQIVPATTMEKTGGGLPPWLPAFSTAALGGLLFGSDIGASSSVVRILGAGSSEFGTLDPLSLGYIASASLFGAMIASAALIGLGDLKNRTPARVKSGKHIIFSRHSNTVARTDISIMMVGRVIYGLGIGTAMHVAPLYIAETSPDNLRGKLVSLKEAAIVLGIVLGYVAGSVFGGDSNWRGVFESVLPFEALMLVGSLVVPESPRWLALRGRSDDAVDSIQQIQGLSNAEAVTQVKEMVKLSGVSDNMATDTSILAKVNEIFDSKYNMQALKIGVGLVLFQQLSGQPSVLYFANRIFENAGLGFEAAVGVGLFKFAMTLVSASLVENPNFGRRTLLLYGNAGITASLVALSALYSTAGADGPNQAAIIACILGFVGCYQIGFGPITWLVLSEIFPLRIRSAAVSIGTLANFGSNVLVALLFESERLFLGEGALFAQFAAIALAATVFTNIFVFETRGLTLEKIELKLRRLVDEKISAADMKD